MKVTVTKEGYARPVPKKRKAASDKVDRELTKARRTLALDVIAPLKGLAKMVDDKGVFTMEHGEPKQDFKIPGMINSVLKKANEVMHTLTYLPEE
jgi:hypothetical protein